ncbi:hypothetical protein HGRIS_013288 [Hohenbuehelia grisea]|uniref:Cytochrome b561 domain-containing protein n=1 Tax=Hohenbuehelia grisea TaxID=104357 RepID=A0ABR3IV02_9AGAR
MHLSSAALWLSLQALPAVLALKGDSWCGFHMCVNATADEHYITYEMTNLLHPMGWMSIGFGKHMTNTHMVVMWKNSNNSSSITQRIATDYVEPNEVLYPPRRATTVDNPRLWGPAGSDTVAFRIPLNRTALPKGQTKERYIWGFSKTRPASANSDEHINMHFGAGYFELDLTKDLPDESPKPAPTRPTTPPKVTPPIVEKPKPAPPQSHKPDPPKVQPPPPSAKPDEVADAGNTKTGAVVTEEEDSEENDQGKRTKLIVAHGVLASAGFLVLLPMGTLVARWGRTLSPHWFKVHWIFNMILAVPVVTLGWMLGPVSVMKFGGSHFSDAHRICGMFLYALFCVQVWLGQKMRSRPATPNAPAHPPTNKLHMGLGLLTMCLAFFQASSRSGFQEFEQSTGHAASTAVVGLWNAWVVMLPIFYLVGLAFIPQQLARERSGEPVVPGTYIALASRPDDSTPRWNRGPVFSADEEGGRDVYHDGDTKEPEPSDDEPLLQNQS